MPIPAAPQAPKPTRATSEYTRGGGLRMPELSPVATLPNISSKSPPVAPVIIGMDIQTTSIAVPSLAQGASQTFLATMPFPRLPSATPQPLDTIVSHVSIEVTGAPSGLSIAASSAVVTCNQGQVGGPPLTGPVFAGGSNLQNWGVTYSVTVLAVNSTAASNLTATIHVQLYLYIAQAKFNSAVIGAV